MSPSVDERARRLTQGGTIPRSVPMDGYPDLLQALKKEIGERLSDNWRDARLRLLATESEHEGLMSIGLTCARLWNELNHE